MSFPNNNFRQTAVYWGTPTPDGYGGHTFTTAVEISVRWEQKKELFKDADGNEFMSNGIVYTDTDLTKGDDGWGYLFLGTLADLPSAHDNPANLTVDVYEIKDYMKTPTIKGDKFLRKIIL